METILETNSGDCTSRIHHARRSSDGQWFTRYQERGPFGYRWGAWRPSCEPTGGWVICRKARLPKAVA